MRARGLAIAAGCLTAAVPTSAGAERVVDYTIDEATAAHNATEQGVPLAPLPTRGSAHIAVQIGAAVDHQVLRAGIACSAWTVRNPMSVLVRQFLTAWDRDGAPAASFDPGVTMLVKIDRASTLSRCVGTGEMKSTCITRVSIDGAIVGGDGAARPFHTEREAPTRGLGVCAGLTRGIGLVSREAVGSLVAQLAGASTTVS
ncbi:hypothetical protein [Sphingomonas bacterium]|uniref:hypothetical protein n=1 Tax=Sphingomonas bacterium TaxID=1895847 RepID=UPI001576C1D6|nr:hypothetical protein [Sphingomonas bacterium]